MNARTTRTTKLMDHIVAQHPEWGEDYEDLEQMLFESGADAHIASGYWTPADEEKNLEYNHTWLHEIDPNEVVEEFGDEYAPVDGHTH